MLFAIMAPRIPVTITTPTVIVEIPPILSATPIAMAVVIDLGNKE